MEKIFFRIAEPDILTLLDKFSEGAMKKNSWYKRIRYEKWKRLKSADNWEIRFSDGLIHEDSTYSISYNGISVRAIYGDPANDLTKYEQFEFNIGDKSFGTFLSDMRNKGVLEEMSNNFDNNWGSLDSAISAVAANTTTASDSIGELSSTVSAISSKYDSIYVGDCINWNESISTIPNYTNIDGAVYINGADITNVKNDLDALEGRVNKLEKEKNNMNTGIKFNFGTCEKDNIRMSMYGIAIRNAVGEWVSYDSKTGSIINVNILNFGGGKYLFKMPVAIKDIKKGDVIVHNGVPMYVTSFTEGTKNPVVIDPKAGEEKVILPTKNMFGFDFVTKVVSLFDMGSAVAPSKDSPFGNMWPLMLADGDVDPMMLMMMSGNMGDMNPMMMYLLMDKSNNKDMGLLMAMSMMNKK